MVERGRVYNPTPSTPFTFLSLSIILNLPVHRVPTLHLHVVVSGSLELPFSQEFSGDECSTEGWLTAAQSLSTPSNLVEYLSDTQTAGCETK